MSGVPFTEHIDLDGGGTIHFTLFPDGEIRLAIEKQGVRVNLPLSLKDARQIRRAALGVNLAYYMQGIEAS